MYDVTDPRSVLVSRPDSLGTNGLTEGPRAPQFFELASLPPTTVSPAGGPTWLVRTQHLVLAYTQGQPGDVLRGCAQDDEYILLTLDPDADLILESANRSRELRGERLTVVAPGDGAVVVRAATEVVRVFASSCADLTEKCVNRDRYATADGNVAGFSRWPRKSAAKGHSSYDLSTVTREPDRLGRIYRCSIAMLNVFYPEAGPRDTTKMSPHHHDDFEQLSLQLAGDYVHHVRTPWAPNLSHWRPDVHQVCTSPSIAIFPPPLIHTSQAVGAGRHQLVDVFGPPRADFSDQPGWVLNAADYPRL